MLVKGILEHPVLLEHRTSEVDRTRLGRCVIALPFHEILRSLKRGCIIPNTTFGQQMAKPALKTELRK